MQFNCLRTLIPPAPCEAMQHCGVGVKSSPLLTHSQSRLQLFALIHLFQCRFQSPESAVSRLAPITRVQSCKTAHCGVGDLASVDNLVMEQRPTLWSQFAHALIPSSLPMSVSPTRVQCVPPDLCGVGALISIDALVFALLQVNPFLRMFRMFEPHSSQPVIRSRALPLSSNGFNAGAVTTTHKSGSHRAHRDTRQSPSE